MGHKGKIVNLSYKTAVCHMALSYDTTWEDLGEDTENMITYKFTCVGSELIYACTRYYLHVIHIFHTVMNIALGMKPCQSL
jgi:hypothetical protein